ncbi:MAG: hypothetical protein U9N33_05390 [Campylobacterota bacterium]|nr:hypothetical protein [Campylobacterota bacterium]
MIADNSWSLNGLVHGVTNFFFSLADAQPFNSSLLAEKGIDSKILNLRY